MRPYYVPQPQQRFVRPAPTPISPYQYHPRSQPITYAPARLPYYAQPQMRPAPSVPITTSMARPYQTIPSQPYQPYYRQPIAPQPRAPVQSFVMASPVRGAVSPVPYPMQSPVQSYRRTLPVMQSPLTKQAKSYEVLEAPKKEQKEAQPQEQKVETLKEEPEQTQQIHTQQSQDQDPELEDLALQYEDGFIYRGQGIAPQTRHGFGVLSDSNDNEVYSGFWKDNNYHGDGRLNNLDKADQNDPLDSKDLNNIDNYWDNYDGEFQEGKMHGKGKLTLTNGESYEGEFKDGTIEGAGKYTTQNGDVVEGNWEQGRYKD